MSEHSGGITLAKPLMGCPHWTSAPSWTQTLTTGHVAHVWLAVLMSVFGSSADSEHAADATFASNAP
jgi:hypothetical protein